MASDNSPFHWLGLLKWSLAYSDGTRPPDASAKPMSREDVEFLEGVMREGIIDEGERMKCILRDLTDGLTAMLAAGDASGGEEKLKELDEDEMLELLRELRDIVEQVDYARAFMAMGGVPFLLGCAAHRGGDAGRAVPRSIRKAALGTLSTMAQNNPPVQLSLLEHGHMPQLIQIFFDYSPESDRGDEADDSIREKVVQALSASVREHAMAEAIFCKNAEGRGMLRLGLGMSEEAPRPSAQLRRRSLFLLRALVTSDGADADRHRQFEGEISFVCTHLVDERWEDDAEIREMGLSMISRLLRQGGDGAPGIILRHKERMGAAGVKRVRAIRDMKEGSEEREYATLELEAWEDALVALAEASSGK